MAPRAQPTQESGLVDAIHPGKGSSLTSATTPRLGPIQTCDTCMVEVDGKMTRACSTPVEAGLSVVTESKPVRQAQLEAMDVILGNHLLYCTVCDNNNENCTVHNTTAPVETWSIRSSLTSPNPMSRITATLFYRYDPDQCNSLWALRRSLPERAGERKPSPSTGSRSTRESCGTGASKLRARAAFPAVIASPSAPAMR